MSGENGVRAYLKTELAAAVPGSWHIIGEQRLPETISVVTVVLKHSRIEKLTEAPVGHLRNTVTLSVFDPHTDIATAEDALDDAVVELLAALDGHPSINWTDAVKVASYNEAYLGWDITLTVITTRPPEEA